MPGSNPANTLEFPLFATSPAGATISYVKLGFPPTTETVTSDVRSGQLGAVATKVKSVGSFKGNIVIGSVGYVHPLHFVLQ